MKSPSGWTTPQMKPAKNQTAEKVWQDTQRRRRNLGEKRQRNQQKPWSMPATPAGLPGDDDSKSIILLISSLRLS
jgi:hypothetical protein